MSLNYHFPLQAGTACEGKAVEYLATAFVTTHNRSAAGRQIDLGKTAVSADDLRESTQRVLDKMDTRERNRLIAVNFFRLCNLRPHADLRLERVAAVAFTRQNSVQFAVKPETLNTTDGIGAVRSTLPTHHLFTPVIDFATTPEEGVEFPVTSIVEAAVARPGNQAYVALRGLETVLTIR